MKNFPFFTTEHGAVALVLDQIPYSGSAYITILDSQEPELLLKDVCDFCLAVGAKAVYASGGADLEKFPLCTSVVLMRCPRERLADTDAALFPVQAETLERFRDIYNTAMREVPVASCLTGEGGKKLLLAGNGYFVHRGDTLLGIGIAAGERIDAVVSVIPGCGGEVEVARTNTRAMRLYEKLGFLPCREVSRWYQII